MARQRFVTPATVRLDLTDGDWIEIKERLDHLVDLVIDGGAGGLEPSSVVDLSSGVPVVVRSGKGDVSAFQQ